MKTSDFIKGLVVAYMDIGNSSRITSEKIAEIIIKYQRRNQMIDEGIEGHKMMDSIKYIMKLRKKNHDDLFDIASKTFFSSEKILQTINNSYLGLQKRMNDVISSNGDQI
ncbi:hypothetical protein ABPG72_016524 [Tetrahymena utriculariae]